MGRVSHLVLSAERRIAYCKIQARDHGVNKPGIVFLGGFNSNMAGNKALWLEDWARTRGRAYVRFDYRGHGESSGDFVDLGIGDWADDAAEVFSRLTEGPQILVGSSMGGWIALVLARRTPERIAGILGIAAAPDFTEDALAAGLSEDERRALAKDGRIARPSAYSEEPYVYTSRLIEQGRRHLVLRSALALPCPVRLLHGTADSDVDRAVALRLLDQIDGPDTRLTLVAGADHRFSDPRELALIGATLDELTGAAGG